MMPRSGLYVAFAGLVMAVLATLSFLNDWNPYPVGRMAGIGFALFLILVAILGLIIMVVGLVGALTKQLGKEEKR